MRVRSQGRSSWVKLWFFFFSLFMVSLFTAGAAARAEENRGSPAALVLPGEFASEHWEVTARFDSGHILVVEFVLTNIGLGDRNAAVFGHVIPPGGKPQRFSNGRTEKHWTLSADRLRMEIGHSLLDVHAPLYKLQIHKRSVRLDLQFSPDEQPRWAKTFSPPGYALDLLALATSIEGTLWLRGMPEPLSVRGVAAMTHSWTNVAGASLVLRRIEFFLLHPQAPLYGVDITAPDGTRRQWIVVRRADTSVYVSEHFDLITEGELQGTHDPGYVVPRRLQLKNGEMAGEIRLDSRLVQADPFIDLPRPIRYLVSLVLDLRPRRIWVQSLFALAWQTPSGLTPVQKDGVGMTAITFLNPLPASAEWPRGKACVLGC